MTDERAPVRSSVALSIALATAIGVLTAAAPYDRTAQFVSAVLVLPAVFWCGLPLLRGARRDARAHRAGADSLASLAILASFTYATVVLLEDGARSQAAPAGAGMRIDYAMSATILAAVLVSRWWTTTAARRGTDASGASGASGSESTARTGRGLHGGVLQDALELFAPTVIGLAGLTLALWGLAGPLGMGESSPLQFAKGLDAAISVLLVASPGAFALADGLARSPQAGERRARWAVGWAFSYNLIALPLAIAGLLSPVFAAIAGGLACVPLSLASAPSRRHLDAASGGLRKRRGAPVTAVVLAPVLLLAALLLAAPGPSALAGSSGRALGRLFGIESSSQTQTRAIDAMAGMDMADMTSPGTRIPGGAGDCTRAACPIPTPAADELSVAGELGPALAALWITPAAGHLEGRVELLTPRMSPVSEPLRISGSGTPRACGPGCWTFALPADARSTTISTSRSDGAYSLTLPVAWRRGQSAAARRLLGEAVSSMQSLAGVRDEETLTSGPPNPVERIDYRLGAPDRMSYAMNTGGRVVVIGGTLWAYSPGKGWQRSSYPAGRLNTRDWYDWREYDTSVQLLEERNESGRMTARIALMSPKLPVWYQLDVDVSSGHVSRVGMIAGGHFMTDRYSEYGAPQRILPPR